MGARRAVCGLSSPVGGQLPTVGCRIVGRVRIARRRPATVVAVWLPSGALLRDPRLREDRWLDQ